MADEPARGKAGHWSFVRLRSPDVPRVTNASWARNEIDAFVLAKLEAKGLTPSAEADRSTLLRRISLDLLGLPPSVDERERVISDDAEDWYEKLVDRLLASPHFGERWGRHWLDLARYADSGGYNVDFSRSKAWRYRSWVIEAINRDAPFDEFTIEQLAGDLLPNATDEQRIATGLHCMTLWRDEIEPELLRYRAVVDRVNTTATIWLGLSVGCAQCHAHKYDPIEQEEYYRLFAHFNNATATGPGGHAATRGKMDAMTMVAASRKTHVHVRGQFTETREDVIAPGALDVLHELRPRGETADRLDLARWLVAPENPLVARVMVNRIWKHLFGRGLVATLDDFGTRGAKPTHPELLDWLAVRLEESGWSRKELIRTIVLSATFRQISRRRGEIDAIDPACELLARQRRWRVEAEVIGDLSLSVSGQLRHRIGGPSVFPPLPRGAAEERVIGLRGNKWTPSRGDDLYRRAMYTHHQRNAPHPTLVAFDCPPLNEMAVERTISNSPLMALTSLNNQRFVESAVALARRVLAETSGDDRARFTHLGRSCLSREMSSAELDHLEGFLRLQRAGYRSSPTEARKLVGESDSDDVVIELAAWAGVSRVFLNLDEFISRE